MAVRLNGTTQYLWSASTPIATYPYTLACWVRLDVLPFTKGDEMVAMQLKDATDGVNDWCNLRADDTEGDEAVQSNVIADGPTAVAEADGQVTAEVWEHYCGVHAASNDHACYMNGANKGTSAEDEDPDNFTRIFIGAFRGTALADYLDGCLAEAAIWNVVLTDAEIASLAKGFSPLFIRPQNLVAYWPLIRDDNDRVGGYNLTAVNAPTWDAHPPIIYPAAPMIVTAPAAVVGETIELDALTATGSVSNTNLALGAVQLGMDVLSAIGSAPNTTLSPGEVQLVLDAISASGSTPGLTLSLGEVQILLDALSATGSAENITLSLATIILLDALSASGNAQSISLALGEVQILLDALSVTGSAEGITLSMGQVQILLDALSGASSAPKITLSPGQVTIMLDTLAAAGQAQNLSVSATLAGIIALNALSASATAQSMTLSPGEATVILTALEAIASAPDIRLATVATAALERLISVLAENRIITVASENRIVTVPAEDRTKTI